LTKNLPDEKSIHELPPALIATPTPRGARLSAHGNLSKRGRGWSSANVLTAKSSAQRRFTLSNRAAEAIQDELYDLKSSPQGLIRIVGNYGNPLTSNTQKRNEIIAIRGQSQWHHGREPASDVFAILVAQTAMASLPRADQMLREGAPMKLAPYSRKNLDDKLVLQGLYKCG